MTTLVLTAGHPFFQYAKPFIIYLTGEKPSADDRLRMSPEQLVERYGLDFRKGWKVCWRDFESVLNDEIFETQAEALAFAATVNKPPISISDDDHDDSDFDIARMDAFWRSLG